MGPTKIKKTKRKRAKGYKKKTAYGKKRKR